MGRYMRKSKVTMEVAQSALGVRTRARTLAMQRRQEVSSSKEQHHHHHHHHQQQQQQVLNLCYLELRSRKLEKFSQAVSSNTSYKKPPKTSKARVSAAPKASVRTGHVVSVGAATISRSNSFTSLQATTAAAPPPPPEAEIEASCGENAFDHDGHSSRDSFGAEQLRRFRESTPSCSEQEYPAEAPGSTSRVRVYLTTSHRSPTTGGGPPSSALKHSDVPSAEEIEDFFTAREETEVAKLRISDRYNFDFVNDVPLPGRFEWTRSL